MSKQVGKRPSWAVLPVKRIPPRAAPWPQPRHGVSGARCERYALLPMAPRFWLAAAPGRLGCSTRPLARKLPCSGKAPRRKRKQRSEERRVGKERRCGRRRHEYKENKQWGTV